MPLLSLDASRPRRVSVGQVAVDSVTFSAAIAAIEALVDARRGGIVLTPNVDHVVLASDDDRFRGAYRRCSLSLADGMPVVWAARALGRPLPEKLSGSDLREPLMKLAAARGFRVFLLGGAEGVARRAAAHLVATNPSLRIVGTASPQIHAADPRERAAKRPWGSMTTEAPLRHDRRRGSRERHALVARIKEADPDLVLVGLGAPKQELWIHEAATELSPAVLLGIGASIDFLAGTARRAPPWVSRAGLEWAFRLAQEPRRMWRRYLLRDPRFVSIIVDDWLSRGAGGDATRHR